MKTRIFTLFALLSLSLMGWAEYVDVISLTTLDTYSQDFNGIGGEDVTETTIAADTKRSVQQSTTLPNGWKVERNMDNPREVNAFSAASNTTIYVGGVSLPSNAKNGTWNFGDTESTDRAIGGLTTSISDGTRGINVMAHLHNNTGENINSITLSYDIEKYRNGSNSAGFVTQLYTSTDGTTWTSAGGEFRKVYTKDDDTNGAAVVPIHTKHVSGSFDVSFPANGDLYLAWNISVSSGTSCGDAQGLAIDNVSITPSISATSPATPVASGELFATYQKSGIRVYEGGGEANIEATSHDWDVNYYIVTCGDSVLLRATTTENNNLGNGWETQLRLWTSAYNNSNEIQVNAGNGKNRYTSVCRHINPSADDIKLHFFINWTANSTTKTINFNRASINNPIDDDEAPIINPNDVTMTEEEGKLIFTFGEVTADDEYFYYVGDKDHNIGGISLNNKVYITKPTVEDGVTYKFRCYAVDYNGNKSAYKEFTLAMDLDPTYNLAQGKVCSAGGYENNDHNPSKANDGNTGTYWGTYNVGSYATTNVWEVDLGEAYVLDKVSVYRGGGGPAHIITLKGKISPEDAWTTIFDDLSTSADNEYTDIPAVASARYLQFSASGDGMIAVKEFEVYASAVANPDATDPTLSVSCIASTINSVTLQIIASDEDDAGDPGTITAINISGDNGFVTQNSVTLDGSNQITLSDLMYNKTYHFTIQAVDLAGNESSANIEVILPFNTELNLANYAGTAIDGFHEGTYTAAKAIDGSMENNSKWNTYGVSDFADNWMQVDLDAAYNINNVKIEFAWVWDNVITHYVIEGSVDGTNWYTLINVTDQSSTSADLSVGGPAQHVRFRAITEKPLGIKEFELYGTAFAVADVTAPIVSASCSEKTATTATLQILAADKDDAGNDGSIISIKVSDLDNGFAEQEVLLDGNNKVTLSGLKPNTTYHFTITVTDFARNTESTIIEVVMPFDTDLDVALGRGAYCEASATQGANTADRAVNGDPNNFWTSFAETATEYWWMVDLGKKYDIDHISIHFNDIWGTYSIYSSDDKENWTLILTNDEYNATSTNDVTKNHTDINQSGQYLKVTSTVSQIGIREFKVFATGYSPITLNDAAEDNSTRIANYDNTSVDITVSRTFANDGYWYTLCLPFNLNEEQMANAFGEDFTLATMTGAEDRGTLIHLNFEYVRELFAGKPYLFKPGMNVNVAPTFTMVTVQNVDPSVAPQKSVNEYMHFQGIYDATTLTGDNIRFVGDDDYLYSPRDGGTPIGAFRCYFTIPDGSPAAAPGRKAKLFFGDENPTGMDQISEKAAPAKIMMNGVLYIIRDGRTYNAQGIQIK